MKTNKLIKVTLITTILVFILNIILGSSSSAIKNLPYFLIYSAGFAFFNFLYFNAIGRIFSWKKNPERTLIISILGVIPVNALIYFTLNLFFKVLIHGQDLQSFMQQINPLEYTLVILFSLVIALFIIIGYFFKAIRKSEMKAEQLKTQNERHKFESLKSQLDPHFLFNNLNVLTGLIGENPEKAEEFTLALSDIYKYVLSQKEQNLVPVEKELDFAKKYLQLLQMRYEKDLSFSLPDKLPKNALLPPLSLQLLLENIIKHNKISSNSPLNIKISIEDGYLVVENKKQLKEDVPKNGVGLQNLINRYALLTKKPVLIHDEENSFGVLLPLIK